MNKKIALKIVLMLIIISLALLVLSTKVQASWPGYWTGSQSDAAKNPHIFCRDHGGPFPFDASVTYTGDGATVRHNFDVYAYIFNSYPKSRNEGKMSDSTAQNLFWNTYIGSKGSIDSVSDNGLSTYGSNIARYANNNYKPNIDTSAAIYDAGTRTYGPIYIDYASWGGYGLDFIVRANGNRIYPTINYNAGTLYIVFTENQITSGISQATLEIQYSYLKSCWADITPIKISDADSEQKFRWFCENHDDWDFGGYVSVSPLDYHGPFESNKVYDILGKLYYMPTYLPFGIANGSNPFSMSLEELKSNKYIYDKNVGAYKKIGDEYYLFVKNASNVTVTQGVIMEVYMLCPFKCTSGCMGSEHCGQLVKRGQLQDLVWVDYGKEDGSGSISIDIELIPTANILLRKYNSILEVKEDNTNKQGTYLGGANFEYKAYQIGMDGNVYGPLTVLESSDGVRKIVPAARHYNPPYKDNGGNTINSENWLERDTRSMARGYDLCSNYRKKLTKGI